MTNTFVLEGLMRVEKLLCALSFIAISTTSCFQLGNTSIGTVKTNSQMSVKSTAISETKSIAVMDPTSTSDQRLTTSQDSPISGSGVVISPGTLGIAASIVLEQGANFGDTSVGTEIGLAGDVAIQGTTAGLIIRPTEAVSLKKPLTISMPLPSGTGLHLAESNYYLVFYKSYDPASGELLTGTKAVDGISAKLVFDSSTNRDAVSFEGYFGAYWVAKVSREVKKEELSAAKIATEPVININRVAVIDQKGVVSETKVAAAQAIPEVNWGAIQSEFQAATRSLKVTASIASGRVLNLCKVDLSEDKTFAKFLSNDAGNVLSYEYAISKRSAHDLFARFRCNDDLGRFTVSPWSGANAIAAATASAPKDVSFSDQPNANFISTVKWVNDATIGFNEHRIKLCPSTNCATSCSEEVSAKSSPAMTKGALGAVLFACVKSVESSGLVSGWVASANPMIFPSGGGTGMPTPSVGPTITQVTSPLASGNYYNPSVIPIMVTFSEPVIVTGGSPNLSLAVAPSATAYYVSGSGSSTLLFNYTIGSGHSAARLNYLSSSSLGLNGATIKSTSGLVADVTLPAIGSSNSLGMTSNITIVIPNNLPVVLATQGNFSTIVGNPGPTIDVNDISTGGDSDSDGDALTYSCTVSMTSNATTYFSGTSCSSLSGTYSLGATNGIFNWIPVTASVPIVGKAADYTFSITANDGRGGNATSTFTIKVISPNTYHYAYEAGQDGSYQFDANIIDYSGGYARLRLADQLDNDNSSNGFASGEFNGILLNTNSIRLGASANCNGLIANCNQLTSLSAELASFREYYPMDETAPSSNNFTSISGATMINDSKVGRHAMQLNGSSDHATIPGNLTNDFTVSFWIRAMNAYTDCSDFADGVGLVSGRHASLANHWGISICNGFVVAGTSSSIKSSIPIINNIWHLITFSRNASTGTIKLYIDGKLDQSAVATTSALTNSAVLNIGNHPTGGNYFQGQLDELSIYDKVLSDAGIQYQFDMQKTERSGFFISQVMDSNSIGSAWHSLAWKTAVPNGKQLPDYNLAIVNETNTDYNGLTTSSLMTGNIGLWHLNEATVGTTAGGKDFLDNSETLAHGQLFGSGFIPDHGRFRSSVKMTSGSYAKMQSSLFELGSSSLTVSAWVKYTNNLDSKIFGTGWITPSTGWTLHTTQTHLAFSIGSSTATAMTSSSIASTNSYNDNAWHHVVGVLDQSGKTMKLYVDGKLASVSVNNLGTCGSLSGSTLNVSACTMLTASGGQYAYLGGASATPSFDGFIDEVALWSRALTEGEIKNLYLRGGNRVKFQVKSCDTPSCSNGVFLGPEGNSTSYYTELLNSTNPTNPLGLAKPTPPNLEFGAVGSNQPVPNRYFQYKVILESDDRNDLCNYGSNASCSPELQSVQVGPDHYPTNGEITFKTAVPFYSFYSLSERFGPAGCPYGARYAISRDGTNWFNWSGSSWISWAGIFSSASTVGSINSGAGLFGNQVGRDTFFIKAILGSDGLLRCELDDLTLQFNSSF